LSRLVQLGLILPQGYFNEFEGWPAERAWARILDLARLAERLGFESIWTGEHVLAKWGGSSPAFDCVTLATALAAQVPRLRLGFIVLNATFRNPLVTAKAAATLDVLSGGRLILGLGAGFVAAEADAAGVPYPTLGERLDLLGEYCAIVRHLTAADHDPLDFAGQHLRVAGAINHPHGLQPRIPLLIGGHGPRRTFRIAARWCDEIHINHQPANMPAALEVLAARCHEVGRDPATLAVSGSISAGWPYRGLKTTAGHRMTTPADVPSVITVDLDRVGTRAEDLAAWRDLGIARLMCGVPGLANADEPLYELLDDCRAAGLSLGVHG
jgi:alkanesulfonate monooxygenase SsuD/methylene tetrahydromethanopterin reductase-like flavin-dependent oxidoreductase (luciferase family)